MIEESGIDGIVRFNADGIKRIELIHAVFPDEPTIIDCSNDPSNYFEFTLNPSLGEVVFDRVAVSLEGQSCGSATNIFLATGWRNLPNRECP